MSCLGAFGESSFSFSSLWKKEREMETNNATIIRVCRIKVERECSITNQEIDHLNSSFKSPKNGSNL